MKFEYSAPSPYSHTTHFFLLDARPPFFFTCAAARDGYYLLLFLLFLLPLCISSSTASIFVFFSRAQLSTVRVVAVEDDARVFICGRVCGTCTGRGVSHTLRIERRSKCNVALDREGEKENIGVATRGVVGPSLHLVFVIVVIVVVFFWFFSHM